MIIVCYTSEDGNTDCCPPEGRVVITDHQIDTDAEGDTTVQIKWKKYPDKVTREEPITIHFASDPGYRRGRPTF